MSTTLALHRITFRAGPTPAAPPLAIDVDRVVVFVGPNNSGKSLALREVESLCVGTSTIGLVVGDVEFEWPADVADAARLFRRFEVPAQPTEASGPDVLYVQLPRTGRIQVNWINFVQRVENRDENLLRTWLVGPYTIRLDGRTRFNLVTAQQRGDLRLPPGNHLAALFQADGARSEVRKLIADAFKLYFVLDATGAGDLLRVRLSKRPPKDDIEERSLTAQAIEFHRNASEIGEFSDGVQAFVGLIAALHSLDHRVLLVDEPEAFLHPTLARRLGSVLTSLAADRQASLLMATHSADLLLGCLEKRDSVAVVRLTYEAGTATARSLPPTELAALRTDPLLRSSRAISGLFHRAVVVTEADADRAFYDEVNRRLTEIGRGVDDALFLNAQNLQTIRRLVRPLRMVGVPAAAVADLDVLRDDNNSWRLLMEDCGIPVIDQAQLDKERQAVVTAIQALPAAMNGKLAIKHGGVRALEAADQALARALLTKVAEYGLFVVPGGELESWLIGLGVAASNKADWIVDVFNRLGDDDKSPSYIRPSADDVWAFIDTIASWVNNPNRKGFVRGEESCGADDSDALE